MSEWKSGTNRTKLERVQAKIYDETPAHDEMHTKAPLRFFYCQWALQSKRLVYEC